MSVENVNQLQVHNFFFHPLNKTHAPVIKAFSMAVVLALSILTGGIYAIALGIVNWHDCRKVSVQKMDPKLENVVKPIFQFKADAQSLSPPVIEKKKARNRKSTRC